jgi:hypothetical protein
MTKAIDGVVGACLGVAGTARWRIQPAIVGANLECNFVGLKQPGALAVSGLRRRGNLLKRGGLR